MNRIKLTFVVGTSMMGKKISLSEFYESNQLISDFLNNRISGFHGLSFDKNNLLSGAKDRKFKSDNRKVLVNRLRNQYSEFEVSDKVLENIDSLELETTFTITTGHQLNIFSGPLFFIYKILQVINITEELNSSQKEFRFVPVFWMASEDHDFDEISYFNIGKNRFKWNRQDSGAVGRMDTEGLGSVFEDLKKSLGFEKSDLLTILKEYTEKETLSEAMLFLANAFFGKYGLVILDADHRDLKQLFKRTMKEELCNHEAHIEIHDTISQFDKKGYKVQVNPREINLFYLDKGIRGRIIKEEGVYKVANTSLTFSEDQILSLLDSNPEQFSPNVVMRPMYQETVIPNIAYIGGAGEIAYWLELKAAFEKYEIPFPILNVRNSLVLFGHKIQKKLDRIGLPVERFLEKEDSLIKEFVMQYDQDLVMDSSKQILDQLELKCMTKAENLDKSLVAAVEASHKRHLKELKKLESKFIRVLKQKHQHDLDAIHKIKQSFFPNGNFQERHENVIPFLVEFGFDFIDVLKSKIGAFESKLEFLNLDEYGSNS